jgi:hypothetical protein
MKLAGFRSWQILLQKSLKPDGSFFANRRKKQQSLVGVPSGSLPRSPFLIPSTLHDAGDAHGIVAVALVDLHFQGRLGVPGVDTDDGQPQRRPRK